MVAYRPSPHRSCKPQGALYLYLHQRVPFLSMPEGTSKSPSDLRKRDWFVMLRASRPRLSSVRRVALKRATASHNDWTPPRLFSAHTLRMLQKFCGSRGLADTAGRLYGAASMSASAVEAILRIIGEYCERLVWMQGEYRLMIQGIPMGCSLSSLFGAWYLKELDEALDKQCFFIGATWMIG